MVTLVAICLDGISWDYIRAASSPNLEEMARSGTAVECDGVVPTVTNVNAASILTGEFPDTHGISSNWYYDARLGREVYMDSWKYLTCRTLLQRAKERGARTLLVTVKDKLRRLLAKDTDASYSVEVPEPRLVGLLGEPPSIYTSEASLWLLRAVRMEIARGSYDIVYAQTTDYIPHKHPPKSEEAKRYVERLDEEIGHLLQGNVSLGVTADHGMSEKMVNVDLLRLLEDAGLEARFIPAIRDEHVVHHSNLGGAAYLYLVREVERAVQILEDAEGVDMVLDREEAAARFRLPSTRIGDLLVLADREHTFGVNEKSVYTDVSLRSHGSLYERKVPLFLNEKRSLHREVQNKDLLQLLMKEKWIEH